MNFNGRRTIAAVLAVVSLVMSSLARSSECSGTGLDSVEARFEAARYVFAGIVVDVRFQLDNGQFVKEFSSAGNSFMVKAQDRGELMERSFGPALADFAVIEMFKGKLVDLPSISFGRFAGDIEPAIGKGYLIFADENGRTGTCMGSTKLDLSAIAKTDLIKRVRSLSTPQSP